MSATNPPCLFNHRRRFADLLLAQMGVDPKLIICTGDLGYMMWDQIKEAYPHRFYTFGAAEQLLVGAAVGLAQEGLTPVVYSITPFLLLRPLEALRQYVGHERADIRLVGSGLDADYSEDGHTHHMHDIHPILDWLKLPYTLASRDDDLDTFDQDVHEFLTEPGPSLMVLRR